MLRLKDFLALPLFGSLYQLLGLDEKKPGLLSKL
jgi:hypothetical protein